MPKKELNDKRERFCQEYVIDSNGTQAAIRAGYSPKTAQEQSSQLLSNLMVQQRVGELQAEKSAELGITAQGVAKRFLEIAGRAKSKHDLVNENRAMENLGKHLGVYGEDNRQRAEILSPLVCRSKE